MTTKPAPAYIKDNAQALKDYLSIRGLKDGEIERAFIRFEEYVSNKLIEKIVSAVSEIPHLQNLPDKTIPAFEIFDEHNLPTGIVAPESIDKSMRLTNRSDIVTVIESFKGKNNDQAGIG